MRIPGVRGITKGKQRLSKAESNLFFAARGASMVAGGILVYLINGNSRSSGPYIERKVWDGVHYATNRYIYEDVLNKADGKLYGPVPMLETDDFEGYWSFIGLKKE